MHVLYVCTLHTTVLYTVDVGVCKHYSPQVKLVLWDVSATFQLYKDQFYCELVFMSKFKILATQDITLLYTN